MLQTIVIETIDLRLPEEYKNASIYFQISLDEKTFATRPSQDLNQTWNESLTLYVSFIYVLYIF